MKALFTLLTMTFSSLVLANQVVTLTDGRQVQLNDDFTWRYVAQPSQSAALPSANAKETLAIPVVKASTGVPISIGSDKPSMQLSDSGLDVLLGAVTYQSGQLSIPTFVTNQGSQSIVLIELAVTLSDMRGNQIEKNHFKIWQSIKRLPDTYLRPKTNQEGQAISFKTNKKESYLLHAEVINIEVR